MVQVQRNKRFFFFRKNNCTILQALFFIVLYSASSSANAVLVSLPDHGSSKTDQPDIHLKTNDETIFDEQEVLCKRIETDENGSCDNSKQSVLIGNKRTQKKVKGRKDLSKNRLCSNDDHGSTAFKVSTITPYDSHGDEIEESIGSNQERKRHGKPIKKIDIKEPAISGGRKVHSKKETDRQGKPQTGSIRVVGTPSTFKQNSVSKKRTIEGVSDGVLNPITFLDVRATQTSSSMSSVLKEWMLKQDLQTFLARQSFEKWNTMKAMERYISENFQTISLELEAYLTYMTPLLRAPFIKKEKNDVDLVMRKQHGGIFDLDTVSDRAESYWSIQNFCYNKQQCFYIERKPASEEIKGRVFVTSSDDTALVQNVTQEIKEMFLYRNIVKRVKYVLQAMTISFDPENVVRLTLLDARNKTREAGLLSDEESGVEKHVLAFGYLSKGAYQISPFLRIDGDVHWWKSVLQASKIGSNIHSILDMEGHIFPVLSNEWIITDKRDGFTLFFNEEQPNRSYLEVVIALHQDIVLNDVEIQTFNKKFRKR